MLLSYLPAIAYLAAIGVLAALGGVSRLAFWLLVSAAIGFACMLVAARGWQLAYRGVEVTEKQPELMAVVGDVMQRAGVPWLAGVWLVPGGGASALTGHRDWRSHRRIGVTVGLLTAAHLSADELAAILAHEAGHLTDPRRLRSFLGSRRGVIRQRLSRPVSRPMRWYWKWFLEATREQALDIERHADAFAVRMYGAELAERAHQRSAEASAVHAIAVEKFVRPWWDRRIAPETLFDAYLATWKRMPEQITGRLISWMQAPARPEDTHPGLAERCGGRMLPLPDKLRGDVPIAGLDSLDRRLTASLRQSERHYPMTTMTWDEIRAQHAELAARPSR